MPLAQVYHGVLEVRLQPLDHPGELNVLSRKRYPRGVDVLAGEVVLREVQGYEQLVPEIEGVVYLAEVLSAWKGLDPAVRVRSRGDPEVLVLRRGLPTLLDHVGSDRASVVRRLPLAELVLEPLYERLSLERRKLTDIYVEHPSLGSPYQPVDDHGVLHQPQLVGWTPRRLYERLTVRVEVLPVVSYPYMENLGRGETYGCGLSQFGVAHLRHVATGYRLVVWTFLGLLELHEPSLDGLDPVHGVDWQWDKLVYSLGRVIRVYHDLEELVAVHYHVLEVDVGVPVYVEHLAVQEKELEFLADIVVPAVYLEDVTVIVLLAVVQYHRVGGEALVFLHGYVVDFSLRSVRHADDLPHGLVFRQVPQFLEGEAVLVHPVLDRVPVVVHDLGYLPHRDVAAYQPRSPVDLLVFRACLPVFPVVDELTLVHPSLLEAVQSREQV